MRDHTNHDVAEREKEELDRKLDLALQDTFPSSDPPAISQPIKKSPAGDPKTRP
jgi:hypothetical protein